MWSRTDPFRRYLASDEVTNTRKIERVKALLSSFWMLASVARMKLLENSARGTPFLRWQGHPIMHPDDEQWRKEFLTVPSFWYSRGVGVTQSSFNITPSTSPEGPIATTDSGRAALPDRRMNEAAMVAQCWAV